ncbi:MAG TPA: CARDB domain-containing protein, partial [Thermoanaerobaculia bacterium]|nr:CARDB domain-containing protein [Thermoanaerobaculia bacterium]
MDFLKTIVVLAVLTVVVVAVPAGAAPGPFQLTGAPSCPFFTPVILFHWTASSGATSYELFRDDGQHTIVTATSPYDTNVIVGGPPHTYFIRASDGGLVTTDSNIVTVSPPATQCSPPPLPFTISGMGFCYPGDPQRTMRPAAQVEWHGVQYATSYDVFRNGALLTSMRGGSSLYDLDELQPPGTNTITYYVIARNAAGTSTSNSIDVTVRADICLTAPPVAVLSEGEVSCGTGTHRPVVKLDWTSVEGVDGWQVYRNGMPYAVPVSRGYSDTNVEAGQTYTYNVATNGLSAQLSNTITVSIPGAICAPGPFSVTPAVFCNNSKSVVGLNWTESVNASSYTVVRNATILASGLTFPAYSDSSVVVGGTYSYQVIAMNINGSVASAPAGITVGDEVCPPEGFTLSAVATCVHSVPSVLLTWSGSAHAASYVISRDGTPIGGTLSFMDRQYIDNGATLGLHQYFVRATNAAGFQGATASIALQMSACGSAPGTFDASSHSFCSGSSPAVRIQWSPASNAVSYVIYRNGVPLGSVLSSSATSYDDTATTRGQSYTYIVVASGAGGTSTALAGTITPSAGDCPPGAFTLIATRGCNPPVTLTWTAAPNDVSSYLIFRNQDPITSVGPNVLMYDDGSALRDAAYSYFVRAVGAGGTSDSNSVIANVDRSLCDALAPDLVALDISPSSMSARAGDTISVSITLTNDGNATAPATTARIRFGGSSSMAASDSVLATIALPAIASLASVQRTVNVAMPMVAAGTYRLFLSLDEEHLSGDPHFADNVKASGAITLADA